MIEPIPDSSPAQGGGEQQDLGPLAKTPATDLSFPAGMAASTGLRQVALIAGFDAGQTHTTCRLADARSGRVLAEGEGPGVSHLAAPGGEERFAKALTGSLREAVLRLATIGEAKGAHGCPDPDGSSGSTAHGAGAALLAAAVGASGIERDSVVECRGRELAAEALGLERGRLWVGGDERTALRGAFPEGAGIIVISGTGTIALGRDAHGREHRCAGWGWLLDGAGSAFDIGRDGLALSLEMADGRRADGPLRQRLWRALDLDPADPGAPQMIKARVVSPGFVPAGLAALAPELEALAAAGESTALAILRRHGEALAESVAGVARTLDLQAPPVAALGGAITHLAQFRQQFAESLAARLPAARLQEPSGDAVSGALAIARQRLAGADREP